MESSSAVAVVEIIDLTLPFIVSVMLLIVGSAASSIGRKRWVMELEARTRAATAAAERGGQNFELTPELMPENLGRFAEWLSDWITVSTAVFAAMLTAVLTLRVSSVTVTLMALVFAFALNFVALAWVFRRDVDATYSKQRFITIPVWSAIAANGLGALVVVAMEHLPVSGLSLSIASPG